MNIPNGHENVNTGSIQFTSGSTEERWAINTGSNTGISLYTNLWSTNYTGTASTINYSQVAMVNDQGQYVYRKPSAIRKPKKKKGDLVGANDPKNRINVLSPVAVFHFVKKRFNLIEQRKLSARLERVCQLLETARTCKQIALTDKINEKFGRFIREQEMIACGFNEFIERDDLQLFINRCAKPNIIKLTKIKNYIRVIPKNVRQKLEKAQKSNLFDEYLILHTDPDDKSVEKTKEEKKDPILFGVIGESSKYYVIGDWTDEFCDITMDKIMEELDFDKHDITLDQDIENALLKTLFESENA